MKKAYRTQDTIIRNNIYVMGMSERKRKAQSIFKTIMAKNIPNLGIEIDT